MTTRAAECAALHRAFREGGFVDALRDGGPALARVLSYVESFGDPSLAPKPRPHQSPDYPLFPGLRHRAFRDAADFPAASLLEAAAMQVARECAAMNGKDWMRYAPPSMVRSWSVRLFRYMGVDVEGADPRCPFTAALVNTLPGTCLDYPWADALLSVHAPRSHLRPHCSVDNLRVRCHLALQVPTGCRIRVAGETREWENGRTLWFEDSFEHEVWNPSDDPRAILIVDFWHPDLTPLERRALVAGFAHSSVRGQFLVRRLRAAEQVPDGLEARLRERMEHDDALAERSAYWSRARSPATAAP